MGALSAGCTSTGGSSPTETARSDSERREDFRFSNKTNAEVTARMYVTDEESGEPVMERSYDLAPRSETGHVVEDTIPELRGHLYAYEFSAGSEGEASYEFGPYRSTQLRVYVRATGIEVREVV
ncbi:hypothetical protein [Haloglomus litoreum]|uniref:hypothetical protein n=1 Tax=Haloglomus litoreum TaxID=3034026 RepID=UPI0023E7F694|nr:hypothetical protein [Haloglomus sp. DT116]